MAAVAEEGSQPAFIAGHRFSLALIHARSPTELVQLPTGSSYSGIEAVSGSTILLSNVGG